jgi:hypothetical protein
MMVIIIIIIIIIIQTAIFKKINKKDNNDKMVFNVFFQSRCRRFTKHNIVLKENQLD